MSFFSELSETMLTGYEKNPLWLEGEKRYFLEYPVEGADVAPSAAGGPGSESFCGVGGKLQALTSDRNLQG